MVCNYWNVIQVSDRRLTLDGQPWDDQSNKSVVFGCRDALLSITYTGLAYIADIPTDEWVTTILEANNAQHRDMGFAVDILCSGAARAFKEDLPTADQASELTFLIAGWHWKGRRMQAYVWWITNCDVRRRDLRLGTDFVKGHFRSSRTARVGEGKGGFAIGARAAIDKKSWDEMSQQITGRQNPEPLIDSMINVIRKSSDHPQYGNLIGNDCMVVVLPRPGQGDVFAEYRALQGGPVTFTPRILTPNITSPGLEMVGPGLTLSFGGVTIQLKGSDVQHPSGVLFSIQTTNRRPRPTTP